VSEQVAAVEAVEAVEAVDAVDAADAVNRVFELVIAVAAGERVFEQVSGGGLGLSFILDDDKRAIQ
jgi:hypothetical protein